MDIVSFIRKNKFLSFQLFFDIFVVVYFILNTIIAKKIFKYYETKFNYLKLNTSKKNIKRIHEKKNN